MVKPGKKLVDWVFERTRKHEKTIQKYEWLGLAIFVGIPLPLTGAWTGSILAFIMGLKFWPSIAIHIFGVLIAGVIVTALSLLGWTGAIIAADSLDHNADIWMVAYLINHSSYLICRLKLVI